MATYICISPRHVEAHMRLSNIPHTVKPIGLASLSRIQKQKYFDELNSRNEG
jgi:hypothetical protein